MFNFYNKLLLELKKTNKIRYYLPLYFMTIVYFIIAIPISYISSSYLMKRFKQRYSKTIYGKITNVECNEFYFLGIRKYNCNLNIEYKLDNINKTIKINTYEPKKVNDDIKLDWYKQNELYISDKKKPSEIELIFLICFIVLIYFFFVLSFFVIIQETIFIIKIMKK
jgi:hypothetical protein